MYKNFNLTDEERQQIMEQHKSHGYRKPINEQGGPIDPSSYETNINGDNKVAPPQMNKPQPQAKPHPFALLIANLKHQLTGAGLRLTGNNTYTGKVGRNNVSVVLTNKGITASKKSAVPSGVTNTPGMTPTNTPLMMDYSKIDAMTIKKQLFDYFNK